MTVPENGCAAPWFHGRRFQNDGSQFHHEAGVQIALDDIGQGYLFGKAMPAAEAGTFVKSQNANLASTA